MAIYSKVWAKHVEKSKISKISKFFSPIGPKLIQTKRIILNTNLQKKLEESVKFEKKSIFVLLEFSKFFLKNRVPSTSKALNSHFRALTHLAS